MFLASLISFIQLTLWQSRLFAFCVLLFCILHNAFNEADFPYWMNIIITIQYRLFKPFDRDVPCSFKDFLWESRVALNVMALWKVLKSNIKLLIYVFKNFSACFSKTLALYSVMVVRSENKGTSRHIIWQLPYLCSHAKFTLVSIIEKLL